ncbi:MAG TPA: aspartate 1-decarboxylase [Nitrospirae bacterium]|nr:aspartate 1-decarboxylase precursor [bacterium BMS3Abin08]HDY70943.1 aspartate 1-decarboxylase [Nitrospirota bacterium]
MVMTYIKILKSKLHMGRVTEANVDYEGSCTIDEELMELADLVPFELILISNYNNGERFETYVIPGERGSGKICLNGAAAHKGSEGDRVFIFSWRYIPEGESEGYKPKIIMLSEDNRPKN